MSLCMFVQTKDRIIISADSRACITEKGIDYANGDDAQKIYHIDNMVIFSGGSQWVADETIKKFYQSNIKSINELNNLGKKTVEEFNIMYPSVAKRFTRKFEVVVATFEGDTSVIYSLSSHDGYKINKLLGDDEENIGSIGYGRDEVIQLYRTLKDSMDVISIYQAAYDMVSDERVGGTLTIFELSKDNIKKAYIGKITDRKPIRKYKDIIINNRFSIGPEEGFVSKKSDNTVKTVMNATEGISIQLSEDNGNTWEAVFYVFIVDGVPKLYLGGPAVFKGDINTEKSATIGELLKLISPTNTFNSGIQMISNDGSTVLARVLRVNNDMLITNYGTGDIDITSGGDINLVPVSTGGTVLHNKSYIGSKALANQIATQGWVEDKDYAVKSNVSLAFETVEGYTVLVNDGIITDVIIP